jgi:hypothetical protein
MNHGLSTDDEWDRRLRHGVFNWQIRADPPGAGTKNGVSLFGCPRQLHVADGVRYNGTTSQALWRDTGQLA